jgi:serine/threonine protein phosphatase PrpC
MQWTTRTEDARRGRGEDRVAVVPLPGRTVVIVADGAGGVAGGATAAETVCKAALEHCERGGGDDWVWWLASVDREMASSKAPGLAAVVIIEIRDDGKVVGASVGDCEAWAFSEDMAPRNLTAEQIRKPLLGEGVAAPVGFQTHVEACSLLVATDGLWKYLDRSRIAKAATTRPLETACDLLVDGVRLKSGALQDDVAVAIVECK